MGIYKKTCEKIRTLYKNDYTIAELAKRFKLRDSTILAICNNN